MPFLVRHIFDDVFTNRDLVALRILPVAISSPSWCAAAFAYGSTYLTEYVGQRIIADLRTAMNRHMQHLPLSFFNRTPTGTIVSRVTNDVARCAAR